MAQREQTKAQRRPMGRKRGAKAQRHSQAISRYFSEHPLGSKTEIVKAVETHLPAPMLDNAPLVMTVVKERLRVLGTLVPAADESVMTAFGEYLADYLNDRLVPVGFMLGFELAVNDLKGGVNGFTGQPIRGRIAGYPPFLYTMLAMDFEDITKAVCPEAFANAVLAHRAEVNKKMAASVA